MSWKIYDAYRIPTTRLNEYLHWARSVAHEKAADFVREATAGVKPEALPEPNDHVKSKGKKALEEFDFRHRCAFVLGLAQRAHESSLKEYFDLTCSLNIWIRKGRTYIIPIGPRWFLKVLEEAPDYVEDFGWWNNTDRPEEINAGSWRARERVWRGIYGNGNEHNQDRLNYEIITMDDSVFGFWDLAKMLGEHVGMSMSYSRIVDKREMRKLDNLIETAAMTSKTEEDPSALAGKTEEVMSFVSGEISRRIKDKEKSG